MTLINEQYERSDKDEIILEQWSKTVEMADTSIDKRINSINVDLTIEAALIAIISFTSSWWNYAVAVVGVFVSVVWYMSLKSYSVLSKTKYSIINEMEEMLPSMCRDCRSERSLYTGFHPAVFEPADRECVFETA